MKPCNQEILFSVSGPSISNPTLLIQTWCVFHSIARALISIFNIGFPTKLKASLWALSLGGTIENDDQLITNST